VLADELGKPANAMPPPLAPSVEEAYRRKCIQLKARTKEVEESNDAARIRLGRMQRQIEKMRLERAILLEQLARRTSTNVEDSDGSPSPPPTVSIHVILCSPLD
jgi:non-histone protein 10